MARTTTRTGQPRGGTGPRTPRLAALLGLLVATGNACGGSGPTPEAVAARQGPWCSRGFPNTPDEPQRAKPESADFTTGLQAFRSGRWHDAAAALLPVLRGTTGDDQNHVEEAQYMFAMAILRDGNRSRAQGLLTVIASGDRNSRAREAAAALCDRFDGKGSDRLAPADRALLGQAQPLRKRKGERLPEEIRDDQEKLRTMTAALTRVGAPDLSDAGKGEAEQAGAALREAVTAFKEGDGDEMVGALGRFDLHASRMQAVLDGKRPCEADTCTGAAAYCCWDAKAGFGTCVSTFEACEATGLACGTEEDCPRGDGVAVAGCDPLDGAKVRICTYRFLQNAETNEAILQSTNEANAWDRDCGPDTVRADPAACAKRCASGNVEACGRVCSERADPVKRVPTCQRLCRKGDESACRLACTESTSFCNMQCRAGLGAACGAADDASREVGERVAAEKERSAAEARLPGLFGRCEANRAHIFRWKKVWIAAQRAGHEVRAQEATAKIAEIEPQWGATLGEIREAIRAATGDQGPRFRQLVLDVKRRCSLPSSAGF